MIKSDPDMLADFVSSSTGMATMHAQATTDLSFENKHLVPLEGTTIKPSIVKLCKLNDIDIELWTSPIAASPAQEP